VTPSISASSRICGWPAPLARRKDSASAAVSAVSMPVPSQATIRRPNATAPVPARSSSRRHSERPAAADRRRPARSAHRGDGAAWSPNRTHRRGAHSRSRRRRPRRSCRTRCGRRCADGDSPADADPAGQVAGRGTPRAADQGCTMDGRHERSPAHGALARDFHGRSRQAASEHRKGAPELGGCGLSRVTTAQEPEHLSGEEA